jgi:predicted protein tyrosine phosphatase
MRLRFTSREEAEAAQPDLCSAVLSITNPDSKLADIGSGWFDILRLQFHDIDLNKPISAHLRADILRRYQPITEEQAADVVRFVARMVDAPVGGFLIHCEAGIGRSAAVAKWIADRYRLPSLGPAVQYHNRHVYQMLTEADKQRP